MLKSHEASLVTWWFVPEIKRNIATYSNLSYLRWSYHYVIINTQLSPIFIKSCGVGEDSGCWRRLLVLEKISLDCKEIQSVHPKGDQSWVFIGRTDAEAETPILWPPHVKSWLVGKDPDAGRDWGQEEKGMTEDEMAGWHHWLDGHEFE